MTGGVSKKKQPDEISKYGRLPGSTHSQMDYPIDEKIFDVETLHRSDVKGAVSTVNRMKERDILGKHKGWNAHTIVGNKPGEVRFPDPCMKATNSKFTSIPEYEYNLRSEYIPRFEGVVAGKPSRRRFGVVDERDDRRVVLDGKYEPSWTNDKGERCTHLTKARSYKRGEQPITAKGEDEWDKPQWNVSVSTECMEDKIERETIYRAKEKKAMAASAKKNEKITTTRMGLLHRHNAVAAAIREKKTEARTAPAMPKPLPPTIAAIRRSERQTKSHAHTGVWEMNKTEGRMMWSDTGSYEFDSMGDNVKVHTSGAWTFAAPQ